MNTTASGNIRFIANHTGDTGNLSYTTSCNGGTNAQYFRANGTTLTLKGCTTGTVTLKLYKHKGAQSPSRRTVDENYALLTTYNISVTDSTPAPTASGTPTNQTVNVSAITTVDVSSYFVGTVTSYAASSSDTAKATASMNGSTLTISGVAPGTARINVTATNSGGSTTQDYPVTVTATTTTPTAGGPTVPPGGPSVNAYSDQAVTTGASVSLTGYGSPVDDDDDATYNWTQQSVTTVSLKNSITNLAYTSGLAGSSASSQLHQRPEP